MEKRDTTQGRAKDEGCALSRETRQAIKWAVIGAGAMFMLIGPWGGVPGMLAFGFSVLVGQSIADED